MLITPPTAFKESNTHGIPQQNVDDSIWSKEPSISLFHRPLHPNPVLHFSLCNYWRRFSLSFTVVLSPLTYWLFAFVCLAFVKEHEFGHNFVWKDRAGSIAEQRLSPIASHRDSSDSENVEDLNKERPAVHSTEPTKGPTRRVRRRHAFTNRHQPDFWRRHAASCTWHSVQRLVSSSS